MTTAQPLQIPFTEFHETGNFIHSQTTKLPKFQENTQNIWNFQKNNVPLRVNKQNSQKTLHMPTLTWIGKEKVVNHHLDVPFRVLDRQYTFGDTPDSGNKIIHGDNLEALKALLPEYEGKIKCIYIDPPYNTGNEKWVYNDNVNDPHIRKWLGQVVGSEMDDLTRHDKWLCMMYPRLVLLQKLLSEDGTIFISIDDNEVANLKLICEEIFGKNNFIAQLTIESGEVFGTKAAHVNKTFVKVKDYVLVFSKRGNNLERLALSDSTKDLFDTHYSKIYKDGKTISLIDYLKNDNNIVALFNKYSLPLKKDNINVLMGIDDGFRKFIYDDLSPILYTDQPFNAVVEVSDNHQNGEVFEYNGYLIFKTGHDTYRMLLSFKDSIKYSDDYISQYGRCTYRGDLWKGFHIDMRNINDEGDIAFKNAKKPTRLVEQLIKWANYGRDSIILDSFAGSGTTAHAVLNLNKQDGGNRKFILVELGDYAENITAERARRVISGYGEGKNAVEGTGGSFDFYELGDTLFDPKTENLNDNANTEQIRQYVWYSETHAPYMAPTAEHHPYWLGTDQQTNYYFYYIKGEETCLSWDFLRTLTPERDKAEMYIIYADRCVLTESEMQQLNIRFKKIPRDIKRV